MPWGRGCHGAEGYVTWGPQHASESSRRAGPTPCGDLPPPRNYNYPLSCPALSYPILSYPILSTPQAYLSRALQHLDGFLSSHPEATVPEVSGRLKAAGLDLRLLRQRGELVAKGLRECASDEGWTVMQDDPDGMRLLYRCVLCVCVLCVPVHVRVRVRCVCVVCVCARARGCWREVSCTARGWCVRALVAEGAPSRRTTPTACGCCTGGLGACGRVMVRRSCRALCAPKRWQHGDGRYAGDGMQLLCRWAEGARGRVVVWGSCCAFVRPSAGGRNAVCALMRTHMRVHVQMLSVQVHRHPSQ